MSISRGRKTMSAKVLIPIVIILILLATPFGVIYVSILSAIAKLKKDPKARAKIIAARLRYLEKRQRSAERCKSCKDRRK